jgi:hypothetical protein
MRLVDPAVSRFHCSLLRTVAGAWVIDLLGRGGIVVNGRRVRAARLEQGDLLQVGPFLMRIRTDPPPADASWLVPGASSSWVDWSPAAFGVAGKPADTPTEDRPSRDRNPAELADGAVAGGTEPIDPVLSRMTNQFEEMQRQMNDQFQQVLTMMAEMVGQVQRDQTAQVRQEIEQLSRNLGDALPAGAGAAPRAPVGVPAASEPTPADALRWMAALLQAEQQREPDPFSAREDEPEAGPAADGDAARATGFAFAPTGIDGQ